MLNGLCINLYFLQLNEKQSSKILNWCIVGGWTYSPVGISYIRNYHDVHNLLAYMMDIDG